MKTQKGRPQAKKPLEYDAWMKRNKATLVAEYCEAHAEEFDAFCHYQWRQHHKGQHGSPPGENEMMRKVTFLTSHPNS